MEKERGIFKKKANIIPRNRFVFWFQPEAFDCLSEFINEACCGKTTVDPEDLNYDKSLLINLLYLLHKI